MKRKLRHFHRYQEIMNAFIKNGFSFIVKELGFSGKVSVKERKGDPESANHPLGERIRNMLEDLGPTFVKLGQMASTRPDLIPPDILKELEKLQDQGSTIPFKEIEKTIEMELGSNVGSLFAEFEETPVAAASIGQVHHAKLHTGDPVAVKVQRPYIRTTMETDLEIIRDLSGLLEKRFSWAKQLSLKELIKEFSESLMKELDYENEAKNGERAASFNLEHDVVVPAVHWEFTTSKVLTVDFINGVKITDEEELVKHGYAPEEIAVQFARTMFRQMFQDGFFHADPHPGNVLIVDGQRIALIDFGLVGTLDKEMKENFSSLIIAMHQEDTDAMIRAIEKMGMFPRSLDRSRLYIDVEEMRLKYADTSVGDLRIGELINEMFALSYRYDISFPPELTLLGKTVLSVESIIKKLYPNMNMLDELYEIGKEMLSERYKPDHVLRRFWLKSLENVRILEDLPGEAQDLLTLLKRGRFRLEVGSPQLDRFLRKMDIVVNRLSYSIVLLAFSIIMSGLIIGSSIANSNAMMWKLPLIEIGFVIAVMMVLWLLYSIIKSGRL